MFESIVIRGYLTLIQTLWCCRLLIETLSKTMYISLVHCRSFTNALNKIIYSWLFCYALYLTIIDDRWMLWMGILFSLNFYLLISVIVLSLFSPLCQKWEWNSYKQVVNRGLRAAVVRLWWLRLWYCMCFWSLLGLNERSNLLF